MMAIPRSSSQRGAAGKNPPRGKETGSGSRTRTCDPRINSPLLYQLSYAGVRFERRRKIPSPLLRRQGWQRRVTRVVHVVFLAYNHRRMSREIVINATRHESRIAVLDEGQVVELWVERTRHRTIVGNIYKGRVTKVLPAMQSAFVALGLERDAFLYVSDVIDALEEYDNDSEDITLDEVPQRPEASISDL